MVQGSGNCRRCTCFPAPTEQVTGLWKGGAVILPQLPVHTLGLATRHPISAAEKPPHLCKLVYQHQRDQAATCLPSEYCAGTSNRQRPIHTQKLSCKGVLEILAFLPRRFWKELGIDVPKFSWVANENSFQNPHTSAHHEKPLPFHWLEPCHMITLSCKGVWNLRVWQKQAELALEQARCLPQHS